MSIGLVYDFLNNPWGNSIETTVGKWFVGWRTQAATYRGVGAAYSSFFFYLISMAGVPYALNRFGKISVFTAPDRLVTYIGQRLKMQERHIKNIRPISPLACLCLGTWISSSASTLVASKLGSGFFAKICQGIIYCAHLPFVQLTTYAPDDFYSQGIYSLRNTLADTRLIKGLSRVIPVPRKVVEFAASDAWSWGNVAESRIGSLAAAVCWVSMLALMRWTKLSALTMISTAYSIATLAHLCMVHKVNALADKQNESIF